MGSKVLVPMLVLLAVNACAHVGRPVAAAALPEYIADTSGRYQIEIDRRVPAERMFALLAAERYQPVADSVRRLTSRAGAARYQRGQWWYDDFDGVRLPYAVTGDAVRYYIDLARTFQRNAGRGVAGAPPMMWVSLRYVVIVTRADSLAPEAGRPRDGYVVEMTLGWSDTCGDLCSLTFQKKRRVWVSPAGRVTAVEGDGATQGVVS